MESLTDSYSLRAKLVAGISLREKQILTTVTCMSPHPTPNPVELRKFVLRPLPFFSSHLLAQSCIVIFKRKTNSGLVYF